MNHSILLRTVIGVQFAPAFQERCVALYRQSPDGGGGRGRGSNSFLLKGRRRLQEQEEEEAGCGGGGGGGRGVGPILPFHVSYSIQLVSTLLRLLCVSTAAMLPHLSCIKDSTVCAL